MSEKKKVYLGVRVRTTVKELLQRHRAREANCKKVKTIPQACLDLQELCASTFPGRYVDPPPAVPPADASSCSARTLQLRAATASFPFSDSSCNIQVQESAFNDFQLQFGELMLPGSGYSNDHNSNNNNNNNTGDSCGYVSTLPPPPTLSLPWCHGLSSDADYYGHGMACSSPQSLKLGNPVDHNSYSPQDSFPSSPSSCYNSPTRMESSYHSFTSEHYDYQHCSLQDCFCLPHCCPGQQEGFHPVPDYSPYYPTTTDYSYACPVEESSFKRDMQMSSEMCYNVL